jgi:4-coumarate--CoA ligase
MQGYYKNPEATKDSVDSEGFVKMGDLGFVDERGFVHVIDRLKDIFKYKGHHINPSEIENVIVLVEGVKSVAVVGIPNPLTFCLIAAVVEKKKGFELLTEDEIIDAVAKELPEYKQLNGGVYFVDEILKTVTGKVVHRLAKEIATERYKENHLTNCVNIIRN